MSHYITKFSYVPGSGREQGGGQLLTVPGQTLSVEEMFRRHQHGINPPDSNVGYFDEEDMDKIDYFRSRALDLTDLHELQRRTKEMAKAIDKAVKAQAAAATPPAPVEPAVLATDTPTDTP